MASYLDFIILKAPLKPEVMTVSKGPPGFISPLLAPLKIKKKKTMEKMIIIDMSTYLDFIISKAPLTPEVMITSKTPQGLISFFDPALKLKNMYGEK